MKTEQLSCPIHNTLLWMSVHGMIESVYVCREVGCNTRVVMVGQEPNLAVPVDASKNADMKI